MISQKKIAEILGLSTVQVRKLQNEKILSRTASSISEVVKSYVKYREDLVLSKKGKLRQTQVEKIDVKLEEAIIVKNKARFGELKLKEKMGELVSSEEVSIQFENILQAFRSKLLTIPSKLAPTLLSIENLNIIEKALKDEIHETLEDFAKKGKDYKYI